MVESAGVGGGSVLGGDLSRYQPLRVAWEGARRSSGVSCGSLRVEDVPAALAGADTGPAMGRGRERRRLLRASVSAWSRPSTRSRGAGCGSCSSRRGCKRTSWFHVTMRLTVLHQQTKGLQAEEPRLGDEVARELTSIKHFLWDGNTFQALRGLEGLLYSLEFPLRRSLLLEKVARGVREFATSFGLVSALRSETRRAEPPPALPHRVSPRRRPRHRGRGILEEGGRAGGRAPRARPPAPVRPSRPRSSPPRDRPRRRRRRRPGPG
jgi:hypothetical protein